MAIRTPLTPTTQRTLISNLVRGVPDDLLEEQGRYWNDHTEDLHRELRRLLGGAQAKPTKNPHADKIRKPVWDYPSSWQMPGWEEQLAVLTGIYPDLPTDGLQEMAEMYLAREDIWTQTFVWSLTGATVQVWDGLLVFPLPGRVAQARLNTDLWPDVAKEKKGEGLWGRLCEEILFPQFTLPADGPRFPGFYNNRQNAMRSDRFLPLPEVAKWLQELEQEAKGGFACRPVSSGLYTAGHAVESSRWVAANELGAVPGCTWLGGHGLVVSPSRLPLPGILALDLPGDRYRFEGDREFLDAPYFYRFVAKLFFDTDHVGNASESYGSLLVLR